MPVQGGRELFRPDGRFLVISFHIGVHLFHVPGVAFQGGVQMPGIRLFLHHVQQRLRRDGNIPANTQVQAAAAAQHFTAPVNLHDFRFGGNEIEIGKIRPPQHEHVAFMHGLVGISPSQQPRHADAQGIVMFKIILSPPCVGNRSFQAVREPDDLVFRSQQPAPQKKVMRRWSSSIRARRDTDSCSGTTFSRV